MALNVEQKFKTSYVAAKSFAKNDDAVNARICILECMELLLELYKLAKEPLECRKIYAKVVEFKGIASELYDNGVTKKVKDWFGIVESKSYADTSKTKGSQGDSTMSWSEKVFRNNSPSVVAIHGSTRGGGAGSGTGFIISENGYLLTNHHVVYDDDSEDFYESLRMTLFGDDKAYSIEIVAADKKYDVALCSFDASEPDDVVAVKRIHDYGKVSPGANVLVIGNGLSMGLAPISGIIKFANNGDDTLVTTVPLNHGDSGSPVFNEAGECIGINKSVTTSVTRGKRTLTAQGISNATPMSVVNRLLDKWCDKYDIEI